MPIMPARPQTAPKPPQVSLARGVKALASLRESTEHWLRTELHLDLPVRPVDEQGRPLHPTLPNDITRLSVEALGRLYGQFVAMHSYASGQLGLVDVDHTEIDYEAGMEEAKAELRADGDNAQQRKANAKLDPAALAKERVRVERKAKKLLLTKLVEGYEKGFKCLSREMSRRGIEMGEER